MTNSLMTESFLRTNFLFASKFASKTVTTVFMILFSIVMTSNSKAQQSGADQASIQDLSLLTAKQFYLSQQVDSLGRKFVSMSGSIPESCVLENSYSSVSNKSQKTIRIQLAEHCRQLDQNSEDFKKLMQQPKVSLQSLIKNPDPVKQDQSLFIEDSGVPVSSLLIDSQSTVCPPEKLAKTRAELQNLVADIQANELKKNRPIDSNSQLISFKEHQATSARPKLNPSGTAGIEYEVYMVLKQVAEQDPNNTSGAKHAFINGVRNRLSSNSQALMDGLADKSGKLLMDVLNGENPFSDINLSETESTEGSSIVGEILDETIGLHPKTKEVLNSIDIDYQNPVKVFENGYASVDPHHTITAKVKLDRVTPEVTYSRCVPESAASLGGKKQHCDYQSSLFYGGKLNLGDGASVSVSSGSKKSLSSSTKAPTKSKERRFMLRYGQKF